MLRCSDNSLYTGITTNIKRRIDEHNGLGGKGAGAKYTRMRQPVELVYQEQVESRSQAGKREAALKKLSKKDKEALLVQYHGQP
jgi:putative endonuclease